MFVSFHLIFTLTIALFVAKFFAQRLADIFQIRVDYHLNISREKGGSYRCYKSTTLGETRFVDFGHRIEDKPIGWKSGQQLVSGLIDRLFWFQRTDI